MTTINGLGTMRYDWSRRPDGTADATLWFVIFFFPIVPLRREHLRVVKADVEKPGFLSTLAAFGGAGSGWRTSIEVLDRIPQTPWRVIQTYLLGFIGVPFVTFIGPMLLLVFGTTITLKKGAPVPEWGGTVVGVGGIVIMIWTVIVVARILDYAAGRMHVAKASSPSDRKRRKSSSTETPRRKTRKSIQSDDE